MKTLDQCQSEIAKKYNYSSFNELLTQKAIIGSTKDMFVEFKKYFDEAAELYASQFQSLPASSQDKCIRCKSDLGLNDSDAGSDREVKRLCINCYSQPTAQEPKKLRIANIESGEKWDDYKANFLYAELQDSKGEFQASATIDFILRVEYDNKENIINYKESLFEYLDFAEKRIKALYKSPQPVQKEAEWISVFNKLPNKYGKYNVCINGTSVDVAYYKNMGFADRFTMSGCDNFEHKMVTHWQSLPTPPDDKAGEV